MVRDFTALPHSYLDEMEELSDEEYGRLIRALQRYDRDGEPIHLTGNERLFARICQAKNDQYKAEFNRRLEANRRNGAKGGRPRKQSQASPDEALASVEIPAQAVPCIAPQNPTKPMGILESTHNVENPKKPMGYFENPTKPMGIPESTHEVENPWVSLGFSSPPETQNNPKKPMGYFENPKKPMGYLGFSGVEEASEITEIDDRRIEEEQNLIKNDSSSISADAQSGSEALFSVMKTEKFGKQIESSENPEPSPDRGSAHNNKYIYNTNIVKESYTYTGGAIGIELRPDDDWSNSRAEISERGSELESVPGIILKDGTFYRVAPGDLRYWQSLYPSVNIVAEIRAMAGWSDANPAKRKTTKGIKRFINAWLSNSQQRGGSSSGYAYQRYGYQQQQQQPEEIIAWLPNALDPEPERTALDQC